MEYLTAPQQVDAKQVERRLQRSWPQAVKQIGRNYKDMQLICQPASGRIQTKTTSDAEKFATATRVESTLWRANCLVLSATCTRASRESRLFIQQVEYC